MVYNFQQGVMAGASAGGGYTIDQSIRFNDDDSPSLAWTPGADASSQTTFTISMWFKRGDLSNNGALIAGYGGSGATLDEIRFNSGDGRIYFRKTNVNVLVTTQVLRDPSAWYHLVLAVNTNDATSGDRYKLYLNGSRVTAFDTATYPSSGATFTGFTKNVAQYIGAAGAATGSFDGYLAEVIMIDGQALDPTDFGKTNNGVWIPKAYAGTYGTNGFYITGENSAALGTDYSGNGNNFTSSGLTSADQRTDTPTNNHCTFNPLWIDTYTLSDGNLVTSTGADASALGTMAVDATDSDGWYWEMKVTTAATYPGVGIILANQASQIGAATSLSGTFTNRYYYEGWSGNFNNQGSAGAYGNTWSGTSNKVIGVYLKGGALWFSIDGVVQNSGDPSTASTGAAITGLTGDFYPVVVYAAGSGTQAAWTAQFAEADWGTTPPAGYKAINAANLPDPAIADPTEHFNTVLWTGDGASSRTISGVGFNPDFVWAKSRSAATTHKLMDDVRGANLQLSSDQAAAEINVTTDTSGGGLGTTTADGFTLVSGTSNSNNVNASGTTFVAWCWKAGNGTASNTDGSITSTVSANQDAGFSIATYTGNATVGATVGHGLGVAPKMVIVKSRSNAENWIVGHDSMGWTKGIYLNSTGTPFTLDIYWNNTAPTSSLVELHDHPVTNGSGYTYVMYSFAEVEGFSKFGSFVGNGSTDGPFIYTGFRPAFILYKNLTTAGSNWDLLDNTRETYNTVGQQLFANLSNVEAAEDHRWDFVSNGFKARDGSTSNNGSGATIIYAAFAENPFGGTGVAPITAR